ncbi:DUF551 domain-containing protein [Klebsiella pneumoniae]|uniref:DUF551 domain-containing protein n=1 Tax=Klebsiella pneumoniae TaxID=573 RepID=UPI000E2AEC78|nr:DUF551 domain-containing protein [Klebsiella pneumoniae]SVT79597.1 Eaa1 [Klebsiella pneumoniae]
MTKSTITRERLEKIKSWRETYGAGSNVMLPAEEAEELARMALAAMDSEPVAYISKSDFDAGYPHILARRDFNKACTMPVYAAQPAPVVPVVPDEIKHRIGGLDWGWEGEFNRCWNACRAAMLQELKKSAGTEAICRSDENVQVLHTKSPAQSDCCPAQSDCCPAQNVVVPAQSPIDHGYLPECECSGCKATARICTEMAVNSLVIPNEMTSEQAYEIGYYYGDPVNVFARGANWMRQHIIDSTLAAAPQLPGSDPATVPGKWIPVSERIPDNTEPVLCIEKRADFGSYGQPFVCWHDGGGWVGKTNYRPIVTHWMPLPAAPQEVKSE